MVFELVTFASMAALFCTSLLTTTQIYVVEQATLYIGLASFHMVIVFLHNALGAKDQHRDKDSHIGTDVVKGNFVCIFTIVLAIIAVISIWDIIMISLDASAWSDPTDG